MGNLFGFNRCIICDNDLNGRQLTCSPECYQLFKFYKTEHELSQLDAVRRRDKVKRLNQAFKAQVTRSSTQHKHTCEGCGIEFIASQRSWRNGTFCSEECEKETVRKRRKQNRLIILSRKCQ